jgi:enoyl-CoA hydratase
VVAAINGTVSGAGLAVALMSDITIAADNAVIFDPHIMLGMATGDGPGGLWPLFTGLPKAKLYLMTSDGLTGAEADRIGLISRAVPLADLQDVAEDYAERLASKATTYSVRLTKRALGQYLKLASLVCNDYSIAVQLLSFYSDERAREPLTPFPPRIVP